MDNVNVTPSKAPRLMQPIAQSKRDAVKLHRLNFQWSNGTNHEDIEESLSPNLTDNDCSAWSDTGSISPLSDISSLPSSSPEIEKLSYLDVIFRDHRSILTGKAMELNRLIGSAIGTPDNVQRVRHEPCHHFRKPERSILTKRPGSLSLLVSSSRGSTEDATIYATEINATIASDNGQKIPKVTNIWERVTIPVNASIKRRHKQLKKALLGDDFDSEEEDYDSELPDAALIEGYDLGLSSEEKITKVKKDKSVRWANELVNF